MKCRRKGEMVGLEHKGMPGLGGGETEQSELYLLVSGIKKKKTILLT